LGSPKDQAFDPRTGPLVEAFGAVPAPKPPKAVFRPAATPAAAEI
jgi:hypothetical protein